ncbi:hypothetical protein [Amycolatopsis sp. DSM 110486]|uniref:phage tail protein n=1 Tax=Amycolatopsis sp. DSM 110486 TaxID=2865832 RepID=UPI001C696EDC|nr:hypothetical protein [Amycolatopsis sp. DSM 110486]QYN17614.1 hypothetical protein K1T34_33045 [Amycolatopsis sp. DSM 110486]
MTTPNLGSVRVDVELNVNDISSRLRSAIRKPAEQAGKDLEKEFAKSGDNAGRSFSDRLGRAIGSGASRITSFAASFIKTISVVTALTGAISVLGTGLGAIVGVVAQASGAIALLPAVLAAAGVAAATLAVGFHGVSDALKAGMTGDADKLAQALAKLAPSARSAVQSFLALRPALTSIRTAVQQNLFAGIDQQIIRLSKVLLPQLTSGLSQVATSLNRQFQALFQGITQQANSGNFATLFTNIAQAADALVPAIAPVIAAFGDLATVGSSFLPALAAGLAGAAQRFGAFIATARETGSLQNFIEGALGALRQLGELAVQVGGIIGAVFKGASASGGGLFGGLLDGLRQVNAALSGVAGQQALGSFFSSIRDAASAAMPVILAIAKAIGTVLAPAASQLVQTLGPALVPVVDALASALQAASPGIQALGAGLALALRGITPALGPLGQLVGILGGSLGQVLASLGPVLGQFASVFASTLAPILPQVAQILSRLVVSAGQLLTAVTPLLGPLLQLGVDILQPLTSIIQALVPPLAQVAQQLLPPLQQVTAALAPVWQQLGQAIVMVLNSVLPLVPPLAQLATATLPLLANFIASNAIPVLKLFMAAWQALSPIINGAVSAMSAAVTFISGLITGFSNVIGGWNSTWSSIGDTVSKAWSAISGFVTNGISLVRGLIDRGVAAVRALWDSAWNLLPNSVRNTLSTVAGVVASIPGRIRSALGNLGALLVQAGRDVVAGLGRGITGALGGLLGTVRSIGSSIIGAISGVLRINSPSKEMAKIGHSVGEGLVLGMDQHARHVMAASKSLGRTALRGMNGQMAGGLPKPQFGGRADAGSLVAGLPGVGGGPGRVGTSVLNSRSTTFAPVFHVQTAATDPHATVALMKARLDVAAAGVV